MNTITKKNDERGRPAGADGIPQSVRQRPALGDLLVEARHGAGITLKAAAKEAGISVGSLSLLEQGKHRSTSLERLASLAEVYSVEPTDFIEAAGYDLAPALPTLTPYLRTKYRQLPAEAHDEIAAAFQRIAAKYGMNETSTGPMAGQDETDAKDESTKRKE